MQAEHGRLLEEQQKWNQDHATAVQELRQDTTTMNDIHIQLGGAPPQFIK